MRIVEGLQHEHRLIEQVAGSLVTFAESADGLADRAAVLEAFCTFFAEYADAHHHAKEEDILFRALLDVDLPEKGPIALLRAEHAANREAIDRLRALGAADRFGDAEFAALARHYCAHLWEHIDKEDSVLFPEIEVRLRLEQVRLDRELDALEEKSDVSALIALGESLIARFVPRTQLPGVFRGEACPACRHYGDTCEGIEREWWSENEWDTFHSRDA